MKYQPEPMEDSIDYLQESNPQLDWPVWWHKFFAELALHLHEHDYIIEDHYDKNWEVSETWVMNDPDYVFNLNLQNLLGK